MAIGLTPSIVGALSCQKDSYLKSLETQVISCEEHVPTKSPSNTKSKAKKPVESETNGSGTPSKTYLIEFADSILFPEGGGQPTDHGSITPITPEASEPITITNLQRHGLRCLAYSPHFLPPGTIVRQEVDFKRRWDHMQQHTGQHLLSAIMDTMSLETLGWSMGKEDEMNYVELPRKPTPEEIQTIQEKCNEAIRNNMPITVETPEAVNADSLPEDYDKEKGIVRMIRIGDLDFNACCGTHMKQTSHISLILLHHTQPIRSTNTRLFFSCGDRAIRLATTSINSLRLIAGSLSSSAEPAAVQASVQRLGETLSEVRKKEKKLLAEIAKIEADRIKAELETGSGKIAWSYRPTDGLDFINLVMFEIKDDVKEQAVILVSGEEKAAGSIMIIGEKDIVEKLSAKAKEVVSGVKGGGKGKWQGKVTEWKKGEIEALRKVVQE